MVTFIIADNQELTRAGIESVIAGDDVRIFHAPDKAELIDLLKQHGDSVVILDYTLFDFTDVDNLLIVGERFCRSRWLLISDDLTAEFLKRIFYSSGQMGVVFKDQSLHIIREAINYTVSGNRYISQRAVVLLLNQQPEEPPPVGAVPTCSQAGVLGAIAGMLGTIQAVKTLEYITGVGELLTDRLLTFDAKTMNFRTVHVKRRDNCELCGAHPTIDHLIDYEQAACDLPSHGH